MKILKNDKQKINIINKSKFIGIVKKINNKEDAIKILDNVRKEYNDATHICYAYSLSNTQKYSDDNEPIGTAGKPILDVLKKNELDYTIAIVIRYFGGIKLGSNGLMRAYSGIISELVKDNTKVIEKGFLIIINEDYNKSDLIDYLLKDDILIKKEYLDKILIKALVKEKTLDKLSNVSYQILEEKII